MINLDAMPTEPYWLDLPGCRVFVRPLTLTVNQAALTAAGTSVRKTFGDPPKDGETWPDGVDLALRNAEFSTQYALALGRYGIAEFERVTLGGKAAAVTPENIERFLSVPMLGSAFLAKYPQAVTQVITEGNA